MALSAITGGARALRLEGADNIRAAKNDSRVPKNYPIVGLLKSDRIPPEKRLSTPFITNCFADAAAIAEAGADIIAMDGTGRPFLDNLSLRDVICKCHDELKKPVWADCATLKEGLNAIECGADIVSTTLYGYTEETSLPSDAGPNFDLLEELVEKSSVPVILEGRVWSPDEVARAFALGAYAVVVGSAITRPQLITERFVKAIPKPQTRLTGGA